MYPPSVAIMHSRSGIEAASKRRRLTFAEPSQQTERAAVPAQPTRVVVPQSQVCDFETTLPPQRFGIWAFRYRAQAGGGILCHGIAVTEGHIH